MFSNRPFPTDMQVLGDWLEPIYISSVQIKDVI